jgi:hypothetical protein
MAAIVVVMADESAGRASGHIHMPTNEEVFAMKSIIGAVCLLALIGFSGNAQAMKAYGGIKGGVNFADLGGDDGPDNSSMRKGFSGGAVYGVDVTEQFSVQGEALYVMKGAEGDFVVPGDDHPHESIIKLTYIDVPVLFVANLPAGDNISFSLFAGPSFNFSLDGEVEIPGHGETVDIKDFMQSFEFGAAAGAGIEYIMSSMSLVLDVRYSLGASSVVEDVAGQSVDVKNSGIGIMAGVTFPFGSE